MPAATTTPSATTCAELGHPGLVFLGQTILVGPVLALRIRLDQGIVAVWAGNVPIFILEAVAGGAASKALAGDSLVRALRSAVE